MPSEEELESLLMKIMQVERRYAFEARNATSNRRSDVKDVIEKFVAELDDDDN